MCVNSVDALSKFLSYENLYESDTKGPSSEAHLHTLGLGLVIQLPLPPYFSLLPLSAIPSSPSLFLCNVPQTYRTALYQGPTAATLGGDPESPSVRAPIASTLGWDPAISSSPSTFLCDSHQPAEPLVPGTPQLPYLAGAQIVQWQLKTGTPTRQRQDQILTPRNTTNVITPEA